MALFVGLCLAFAACGGSSTGTAAGGVARLSSSCIPPEFRIFGAQSALHGPLPKQLSTPLSAAILSRFAIFRRPALSSDELSGLSSGGGGLDRELAGVYELSRYYPAYVRRLARLPDGRRYFVIPAYGRSEAVLPAHCLVGGARERHELIAGQRRLLTEPVDCIVEVGDTDKAPPQGCESFAAISEGGRVFQGHALTGESIVELAPDGVASVRIVYRKAPAITIPVSEDAFLFTPPPPTPRVAAALRRLRPAFLTTPLTAAQRRRVLQWDEIVHESDPTKLEWLDSAGSVIRVISAPAAGRGAATSIGDLRAPIGG
ncbi:MAG: hypothetical protein ACLQBY_16620 [Solirubrobacteraceae bacterium]